MLKFSLCARRARRSETIGYLDCDLYVTIEPCTMCAGAITHARIRRLIYGAEDAKAGAVHSMLQVLNHPKLNHQVEIHSGVLAARCMDLLQTFFRAKREERTGEATPR